MKFPIVKNRRLWFAFSAVLVGLSLALVAAGGLRFGIDFTGGSLLEIDFAGEVSPEEFAGIFQDNFQEKGERIVQTGNGFQIRSREISQSEKDFFLGALQKAGHEFSVKRAISVGPTVGAVFKRRAAISLTIALVAIVCFLAFAFRKVPKAISPWKFGIAAIVALAHDVIITVGVFALLGFFANAEVDSLFITALLTVMGFSVHDTIVVFDRVRENLKGKNSLNSFDKITEIALWQTMSRSINTSLSTIIVLAALLIFGSETLFFFVLALTVGILAGTFSSVFLAAPLLVAWQKRG